MIDFPVLCASFKPVYARWNADYATLYMMHLSPRAEAYRSDLLDMQFYREKEKHVNECDVCKERMGK